MLFYRFISICLIAAGMLSGLLISNVSAVPAKPGTYDPVTMTFYESGQRVGIEKSTPAPLRSPEKNRGLNKYAVLFIHGLDTPETIPVADWAQQIFTINTYPTGSIRDYYQETSYNQFDMDGEVRGWYTAAYNYSHYTPDNGESGGAAELVAEACTAAELEGMDWSQYDNDGDGFVDTVCVIHQGRDAADGAPNQIWSHMGGLSEPLEFDGVKIQQYTIDPELMDATTMETIGTFCHEFGHGLGLPDLYDTQYTTSREPIKNWDIMSTGCFIGSPMGSSPGHFCGWSKWKLGWVTPTIITSDGTYTAGAMQLNPENNTFIMYINSDPKEYFFIENRWMEHSLRFDHLPSWWVSGLLIYHADDHYPNNNGNLDHWKLVVEDAHCNTTDDKPNKNNWDAGYSLNGGATSFTPDTYPSSDGNYYTSNISVINVSNSGETMTFETVLGPTIGLGSYDIVPLGNNNYNVIVTFRNLAGGAATGVTGVLTTDSSNIVIDDGSSNFSDVEGWGAGDNSADPFVIHSLGSDPSFEVLKTTANAANGYVSREFSFSIPINPNRILIVDDDATQNGDPLTVETYFQEPLDLLQLSYQTWEVLARGYPPASVMSMYELVVWEDGKTTLNTPKAGGGLDSIMNFLDMGGDLFWSSHEFIYSQYPYSSDDNLEFCHPQPGEFCYDYLKITAAEQDEYIYHTYGVPGSMFDGLTFAFTDVFSGDPTGANPNGYKWWPDEFVLQTPTGPGGPFSVMTAGPHEFPSGTPEDSEWREDALPENNMLENATCAMTYQGEYRLFFMSIAIHGLPTDQPAPLNRQEVMRRVFNWFGVTTDTPGIDIDLNQPVFHGGDSLILTRKIVNPGPAMSVDVYTVLEAYGLFFFAPQWGSDIGSETKQLAEGSRTVDTVFEFNWPEGVGAGGDNQVRFWTAMLSGGSLVGNYDFCPISWE
jgi:M6 family metalloprotease-like protein